MPQRAALLAIRPKAIAESTWRSRLEAYHGGDDFHGRPCASTVIAYLYRRISTEKRPCNEGTKPSSRMVG